MVSGSVKQYHLKSTSKQVFLPHKPVYYMSLALMVLDKAVGSDFSARLFHFDSNRWL